MNRGHTSAGSLSPGGMTFRYTAADPQILKLTQRASNNSALLRLIVILKDSPLASLSIYLPGKFTCSLRGTLEHSKRYTISYFQIYKKIKVPSSACVPPSALHCRGNVISRRFIHVQIVYFTFAAMDHNSLCGNRILQMLVVRQEPMLQLRRSLKPFPLI